MEFIYCYHKDRNKVTDRKGSLWEAQMFTILVKTIVNTNNNYCQYQ